MKTFPNMVKKLNKVSANECAKQSDSKEIKNENIAPVVMAIGKKVGKIIITQAVKKLVEEAIKRIKNGESKEDVSDSLIEDLLEEVSGRSTYEDVASFVEKILSSKIEESEEKSASSKELLQEAKSVYTGHTEDTDVKYTVKYVIKLFREQNRFAKSPENIKKLGTFKGEYTVDDAEQVLEELGKKIKGWEADNPKWWNAPTRAGKLTSNPFWVSGTSEDSLEYVSPQERDKEIEKVVSEWKKILDKNKIQWPGFKGYESLPKLPPLPEAASEFALPEIPLFEFCQVVLVVVKTKETKTVEYGIMSGDELVDELDLT